MTSGAGGGQGREATRVLSSSSSPPRPRRLPSPSAYLPCQATERLSADQRHPPSPAAATSKTPPLLLLPHQSPQPPPPATPSTPAHQRTHPRVMHSRWTPLPSCDRRRGEWRTSRTSRVGSATRRSQRASGSTRVGAPSSLTAMYVPPTLTHRRLPTDA